MRLFLISSFILFTSCCTAQLYKASLVTKIEKRSYQLIQMRNGDLVPFIKMATGNKDFYLENGKTVKIIFLGVSEADTTGFTNYFYYGDSILVTKEYDDKGWLKTEDSSYYMNGNLKRHFKYAYRSYKTEVLDEGKLKQCGLLFMNYVIAKPKKKARQSL